MDFNIEYEQEEDGRWLAEVIQLPGVLAYGESADKAMIKVEALALRVIAERLEHKDRLSLRRPSFASDAPPSSVHLRQKNCDNEL